MVKILSEHARAGVAARRVRARARRFLAALGHPDAELSVLIVGDRAIRRINREWRGVDAPTDVLSFPAAPLPAGPGRRAARLLGDVVISLDTAERQARALRGGLAAELDRYLVHGLLHLLGFDHRTRRQAAEMAGREEALLAGQGLVGAALTTPPAQASPRRGGGARRRPGRAGRGGSR